MIVTDYYTFNDLQEDIKPVCIRALYSLHVCYCPLNDTDTCNKKDCKDCMIDFLLNECVIVNVEDYLCLAHIIDGFTPTEINNTVVPFDKERVYPIQEIETVIQFKRVRW